MPRTITIHPASLAAGIVFAGLCFLSMSQATVTTPLRVEYLAHPRDVVQIIGTQTYLVPTGKLLTVTALGSQYASLPGAELRVNGLHLISSAAFLNVSSGTSASVCSVAAVPPGVTIPAGSVVTLTDTSNQTPNPALRAFGYLVAE